MSDEDEPQEKSGVGALSEDELEGFFLFMGADDDDFLDEMTFYKVLCQTGTNILAIGTKKGGVNQMRIEDVRDFLSLISDREDGKVSFQAFATSVKDGGMPLVKKAADRLLPTYRELLQEEAKERVLAKSYQNRAIRRSIIKGGNAVWGFEEKPIKPMRNSVEIEMYEGKKLTHANESASVEINNPLFENLTTYTEVSESDKGDEEKSQNDDGRNEKEESNGGNEKEESNEEKPNKGSRNCVLVNVALVILLLALLFLMDRFLVPFLPF